MDKQVLAADAEQILNNIAFKRAQESVDKELLRQLKAVPMDGKPETDVRRKELILSLKMADYYRAALAEMINTGKIEAHNFEQKKKSRLNPF